jgi:hypothetical protein
MSKLKIIECAHCMNKRKILISAKITTQDDITRSTLEYNKLCFICLFKNILQNKPLELTTGLTPEDFAKLSEVVE